MFYKRSVLKNFSKFTDKNKKYSSGGAPSKEKMLLKFLQNSKRNIFPRASFFAGWKLGTFRYSPWRCFVKQNALKNFANFTGNNLCWSLVLMKWQFWETATLLKKTPIQMASCKISCLFLNFFKKKTPI